MGQVVEHSLYDASAEILILWDRREKRRGILYVHTIQIILMVLNLYVPDIMHFSYQEAEVVLVAYPDNSDGRNIQ